MADSPDNTQNAEPEKKPSRIPPIRWWQNTPPLVRYAIPAIGVVFLLIFLVFIIGFGIAIFADDPIANAARISAIKDILLTIAFFLMGLIVIALVALVIQVARLVDTVQGEVKPMIDNAREATETVKGTAKFVSKNVTRPIMNFTSAVTFGLAFMREIGGIRKAIKGTSSEERLGDGE